VAEILQAEKTELYSMIHFKQMSRIFITGLVLFFAGNFSFSQNTIQTAIDAFSSNAYFANASIGFMAMDCSTGQILASKNPNLALSPASTTKLFATATAFQLLGKNYAPQTRIYLEGELSKDGTLNGNLWIRGGGDVALGSRYYNGEGRENEFLEKWADTLIKLGIKKINGAIVADGSEFGYEGAPDGWNWGDMGNYYGAGASGLPIYDNMLRYHFQVGAKSGSKTSFLGTTPQVEGLKYANYIQTGGSGDNSYIYGAPYSLDRFGTGTLGAGLGRFTVKGSLPDSELSFSQEFTRVLKIKGIEVKETARAARNLSLLPAATRYATMKLFFTYKGKTLNSIAWWTNMKSVNLFAEEVLCWIGYGTSGNGSIDNSIARMMSYWSGKINTIGLYITDGSGLSRSNAISASHFCEMLKYMTTAKEFDAFYATLPVAGVSGTLSSVCKNQPGEGKIHAKSGTMKRIKAYSGYVETNSGKRICFSLIINNFNCSSEYTVEQMEKVFNTMVLSE
jgi:D-alanyl-D-alanine carboxypeptidase/D-alanyl-D-alanine-endopeptidase (penicillin-binding protein 4)